MNHFADYKPPLNDDDYLCEWDLCGFKTNCIEMFERHVLHHEMHGRFLAAGEAVEIRHKVPKCGTTGLDRNRLPDLLTDFSCLWAGCSSTFRQVSVLHDHLFRHIDDSAVRGKPNNCQWQGCSISVKAAHLLKDHVERKHANSKFYACRNCGTTRKKVDHFLAHFLSQAPVKSKLKL